MEDLDKAKRFVGPADAPQGRLRKVSISTGFGRKVCLNFQVWDFNTFFTEEVEVTSDEEISKVRRKLALRARAAVFSDILNDFSRITDSLPERPDVTAQAESIKKEAESTIDAVVAELKELEK